MALKDLVVAEAEDGYGSDTTQLFRLSSNCGFGL